ncbi:hypothetical protein TRAPUB_10800 [Trametes pubescens]|uniref:F-box domain-containing protein n=1 Tax=Trametes pubescens TaxID=154538 RepID=A0A1M2VYI0_TRAPU|nr:hypothetical protein TRAPUB_10800 [Trametes pubescens]
MESSRLPIELCEAVMNALQEHCEFPYGGWFLLPGNSESESQPALYACALTCRAWRVRAQYLLWTFPMLTNNQCFTHFKTAIRKSPNKTIIRGLVLSSEDDNDNDKTLDLSMAAELFMHSFPHLQSLLDSFPALRSVTVVSGFHGDPKLPWLHVIAIGRPTCGILKTIVLEYEHRFEKYDCCKEVVGTSEEVVGSEKRLPELLAGLAELTIRLDECEDPGRCAAYIWSVLPGMHDVLRFEYRARWSDAWKSYTLSVVK